MSSAFLMTSEPARGSEYRYDNFTIKLLLQDLRFHRGSLAPGDDLEVEHMTDPSGSTVRLLGTGRPLLLVTGSMTCPMTASAMPLLLRLHREFADRLDFVLLSAREAHPGENYPQPKTEAEVRERARILCSHYDIPFPVVVDDVDGRLHRLLDSKPNAAFLFDRHGTLVFRSMWSSDERRLRAALDAVVNGKAPSIEQSTAMLYPMARAIGSVDEVTRRAGSRARRDLWRSALPMAVAGRVAAAFRFLSPDRRGVIGLAVTLIAMLAAVAAVVSALA
jgi:hypothetical protein